MKRDSEIIRKKVAVEAANLLYCEAEKEYKQAKLKAAKTYGTRILPSNLDVAMEFDRIAEERECLNRQSHLIRMREEALKLMKALSKFHPLLVGSVWRGTIHVNSDIDLIVYHNEPNNIINVLTQEDMKITHSEWIAVTKKGKKKDSFHIYLELPSGEQVEIKVVSTSQKLSRERCEIYGDLVTGLSIQRLESMLKENPTQRFVPF